MEIRKATAQGESHLVDDPGWSRPDVAVPQLFDCEPIGLELLSAKFVGLTVRERCMVQLALPLEDERPVLRKEIDAAVELLVADIDLASQLDPSFLGELLHP